MDQLCNQWLSATRAQNIGHSPLLQFDSIHTISNAMKIKPKDVHQFSLAISAPVRRILTLYLGPSRHSFPDDAAALDD